MESSPCLLPEARLFLYIEDEPEASCVRDLPEPHVEGRGVPGVVAGKRHRATEAVAAKEDRLVHRPAERRPEAGDRQERVSETGPPVEELTVLLESHVVEKRVPSVKKARDSPVGHVPDETIVLGKVDRVPGVGLARQRRNGEHPTQLLLTQACRLHIWLLLARIICQ